MDETTCTVMYHDDVVLGKAALGQFQQTVMYRLPAGRTPRRITDMRLLRPPSPAGRLPDCKGNRLLLVGRSDQTKVGDIRMVQENRQGAFQDGNAVDLQKKLIAIRSHAGALSGGGMTAPTRMLFSPYPYLPFWQ